jgi:hypothetical protein
MQQPDKDKWEKAVEEEHDQMVKNGVWILVPKVEVPKDVIIIANTWAMKKKPNGNYRA